MTAWLTLVGFLAAAVTVWWIVGEIVEALASVGVLDDDGVL